MFGANPARSAVFPGLIWTAGRVTLRRSLVVFDTVEKEIDEMLHAKQQQHQCMWYLLPRYSRDLSVHARDHVFTDGEDKKGEGYACLVGCRPYLIIFIAKGLTTWPVVLVLYM